MANTQRPLLSAMLVKLTDEFKNILMKPEVPWENPDGYSQLSSILEGMYRFVVNCDDTAYDATKFLSAIVTEHMHEEQMWQQMELRNRDVLPRIQNRISHAINLPTNEFKILLKEECNTKTDVESMKTGMIGKNVELEGSESEDEDSEFEGSAKKKPSKQNGQKHSQKRKGPLSSVEDKFFKLHEMEAFLEAEEAREAKKGQQKSRQVEDAIDFFAADLGVGEDIDENPEYKDFYETTDSDEDNESTSNGDDKIMGRKGSQILEKRKNSVTSTTKDHQLEVSEDSGSDDHDRSNEPKSVFDVRQERLKQRIEGYQDERMKEKPWQLKGEIQASGRPLNSLLEEALEFEFSSRPAPVMTEEANYSIEDIIRKRIKDQAWDDVELKTKPELTAHEYRKKLILDQEKSKLSLAQVYETEYQKEVKKLETQNEETEENAEPTEHKLIRSSMKSLFTKLDSLSNFHFTPQPVAAEPKFIINTPAIVMEEVAPLAMSDAQLLAPEEIVRPAQHTPIGETERTKTDKNRERRKKKQKQRTLYKSLDAKMQQKDRDGIALTKKEENAKALNIVKRQRNVQTVTIADNHKSLKSSKSFFSSLQEATSSLVNKSKKKPCDQPLLAAKKVKL